MKKQQITGIIVMWLVAATFATAASVGEPPALEKVTHGLYGDDVVVAMLAQAAGDDDPLVRELAVFALGECANDAALPHLRKAAGDASGNVRSAAAMAAAQYRADQAEPIIAAALADGDPDVVRAGLRAVSMLRPSWAKDKLTPLLSHKSAAVGVLALQTMTDLEIAAPPAALKMFMEADSPTMQLRALRNATLLEAAPSLVGSFKSLAERNGGAVRGSAVAALGKFAYPESFSLVASAARDANPLVRRGALTAYVFAGKKENIAVFLDDPSALVRLSAVQAVGRLRCDNCAEALMKMLLTADSDEIHRACRASLTQIGTPVVVDRAAAELAALWPKVRDDAPAPKGTHRGSYEQRRWKNLRNFRSLAALLGDLRSNKPIALYMEAVQTLPVDSELLVEIFYGLGRSGDKSAVPVLVTILNVCEQNAIANLRAEVNGGMATQPYNTKVVRSLVAALGTLGDPSAVPSVIALGDVRVSRTRLRPEAQSVVQTLPMLVSPQTRPQIERYLVEVIEDSSFGLTARYAAVRAVGQLKTASAVPALKKLLNEDRPGWTTMRAAAWAIGEITGKIPAVPAPTLEQNADWVMRKATP